ncbi:aldo/keto reductase [Paraglaciecola chathamensis]|uniref:Aldo/keto reductase n=1 Tax=Paraglaciecola agarilytica NO2 TaxID=1125747 RepID=A0ABQ0I249_9ALTE|nr:aldo/keto reductase [Paraglaciecola agarilytica]GAC03409.1 aldo/keto reductase [Paraglaciecola agarilytica NO2]
MKQREIAGQNVAEIGLGCMNLSHAYGHPLSEADAAKVIDAALDAGVRHFDSAALYGLGSNEILLGKLLKPHRKNIFLASKCGMTGVDGKRVIDGRPKTLRSTLEQSLQNLQTDVLDLYYLHRWDKSVPIEDSVGELSRLVDEGKIKAIGLSEVSSQTLQKAHAVHPIAAVQTEYSLWTRNPEIAVLEMCRKLGSAFVAFSPLARGYLSGQVTDKNALVDGDIRKGMPRFQPEHLQKNLALLAELKLISEAQQCTMAQVSLAWLLHQGPHIHLIPGTTQISHLRDNVGASDIRLTSTQLAKLRQVFHPKHISGPRYPSATQLEIDTEEF